MKRNKIFEDIKEIDNLLDLIKYFQKHLIGNGVKEKSKDLDYYIVDEMANILPKNLHDLYSPKAIEIIKKKADEVFIATRRAIWRTRKQGTREITSGDPEKLLKETGAKKKIPTADDQWENGAQVKVKVRFPSDTIPLPNQTIKWLHGGMSDEQYEGLESKIEKSKKVKMILEMKYDQNYFENVLMTILEENNFLDQEGGEHTSKIYKILIQYRPEKISAKKISLKLNIPQRTVERRIAWIKKNPELIKKLIFSRKNKNTKSSQPLFKKCPVCGGNILELHGKFQCLHCGRRLYD